MTEKASQRKHACGPEHDAEFFADIQKVMHKHPRLAGKYHIVCVDHETDILKIDFEKMGALKRIEGNTIITEFRPLKELEATSSACCSWLCPVGGHCRCTDYWV